MKKFRLFLLIFSVALIFSTSIDSSMAYFSTYTDPRGGHTLQLGYKTEIEERLEGPNKEVVITNRADSYQDVFVRIKIIRSEFCLISPEDDGSGSGVWDTSPDPDGYYYYSALLKPGESTSRFLIQVQPSYDLPIDHFNVIVLYEAAPAYCDMAGNPTCDWTMKATTGGEN